MKPIDRIVKDNDGNIVREFHIREGQDGDIDMYQLSYVTPEKIGNMTESELAMKKKEAVEMLIETLQGMSDEEFESYQDDFSN